MNHVIEFILDYMELDIKISPLRVVPEKSRKLSRERMIAYNLKCANTVHEKG